MLREETSTSIYGYDANALRFIAKNRNAYFVMKRVVDILVSLLLLILLAPLLLLIALVIYVYSPGPVLFVQERVGVKRLYHGKNSYWQKVKFPCYKFRTMRINADPTIHQIYVKALIENDKKAMAVIQGKETETRKLLHDPRIIHPGRILRKFSLDELPQFWNVLRGDMSLVGPRPAIPYEVEMYQPWHLRRFEAQPGITGLQQVKARSIADFDEQVKLDIEYIEQQSLWLDLKIILKTPLAIISTKGAR